MLKQIAAKSAHQSRSRRPPGSRAGQLDWWVKERREWWSRVRGADGRQRCIRAVDVRLTIRWKDYPLRPRTVKFGWFLSIRAPIRTAGRT
jgi:hypothetical protein